MANEIKSSGIDNTYRSEHEKRSDSASVVADPTKDSIAKRNFSDSASGMADDVAHKAKEAGDTLKDKASDVGHSLQDTGHNIAEKTKHSHKAICDFTKENPTAAVLMAFGVGAILARVLPGR